MIITKEKFEARYSGRVLVYIEKVDMKLKTIVFDFIDSNNFGFFLTATNLQGEVGRQSMVSLWGYSGKLVIEGSYYWIQNDILDSYSQQGLFTSLAETSFILGWALEYNSTLGEFFGQEYDPDDSDFHYLNLRLELDGRKSKIDFDLDGDLTIIIRNVGQGSWNDIDVNRETKIIFDIGTKWNSSKIDVIKLIGNRTEKYQNDCPGIIISHWDVDHYHCLLPFGDSFFQKISYFICKSEPPNLTSRILLSKALNNTPHERIFGLPCESSHSYKLWSPENKFLMIFNGIYHRDRNRSGIILGIQTKYHSILMPGDAHYMDFTSSILPYFSLGHKHFLVVPHHGGSAGKINYSINSSISKEIAIISVGENSYGHPLPEVINFFNQEGFRVMRTDESSSDISIEFLE